MRLEFFAAFGEDFFGDEEVEAFLRDVDGDDVALFDEAYRAAYRGFGRYVADGGSARRAGEASVGDERDGAAFALSHYRGGWAEHFAHAGAALRSFVTDDDDVAVFDFVVHYRGARGFFSVEYARGALVDEHLRRYGGLFDYRAERGEGAFDEGESALFVVRLVERAYYFGVGDFRVRDVFGGGVARDGDCLAVDEARVEQLVHEGLDAAGAPEVFDVVRAARAHGAEVRHFFADFVEEVEGHFKARRPRYRGEVERCVGGAAEREVYGDGVAEGVHREDVARTDVLVHHVHDGASRVFREADASRVYRGYGAVAGEGEAEHFHHTVHGVGGEHAGA